MPNDFSFGKNLRILKESDFLRIKSRGKRRTSKNLILLKLKNQVESKRVGFIVTRKIGKANVRNKWKRYIREFFRLNKGIFPEFTDCLFIVKRGALVPKNFKIFSNEIREIVERS